MANSGAPGAMIEMREVVTTARTLGLEATPIEVRQADEVFPAIESLKRRADALYVATDPLIFSNRVRINAMAQAELLPTIYGGREYVDAGALMSYGPQLVGSFPSRRRAGRQDPARHEARRHPRRAADEIRSDRQSENRQKRLASIFRHRCSPAPTR